MLFGWKIIIYYELLPKNQTINLEKYCSQLCELKQAIEQNRLDNREGIVQKGSQQKRPSRQCQTTSVFGHPTQNLQLGRGVLVHTSYCTRPFRSPIIIRPLQNSFDGKDITSLEGIKKLTRSVFYLKVLQLETSDYYGIMQLLQRWKKFIEQNGLFQLE